MIKCEKCKTDGSSPGSYFTEGGESLYFCHYCSSVLEKMDVQCPVYEYMKDDGTKFSESPVTRSIIDARVKRSKMSLV